MTADAYDAFARRIVDGGILTDPWMAGEPRFRHEPIVVSAALQRELYRASEEVAAVYDEMCRVVAEHPHLLDDFFCLTPYQKTMWLASRPLWHGIARADVFVTDGGLAFTELNCDTPTGEAEAVVLGALVSPEHEGAIDPNRDLGARFVAMVERLAAHELASDAVRTVGIVYPTELTEDLSLVRLYRQWFEERGYRVVLGSPYNLELDARGLVIFDTPFSIMLRHYKTDWWGERVSVWDDARIADVEPLERPLRAALSASVEGRCAIVNPFGSVLPQNKRAMALMWEHVHCFSPGAEDVIRRHIPLTSRLETMHEVELTSQKDDWVIKSDYGAEGEEVIVGRHTSAEVWRASIAHARPGRWIAQRYFEAHVDDKGQSVNYGVYLIAGEAAGLYTRMQTGPTDDTAVSAPVLVRLVR
jgi:glutathionylspermidine synthase